MTALMANLTPPPTPPNLPAASSPTLKLVRATPAQAKQCWDLNGPAWRGPLTQEAYVRREEHIGSHTLTRDGGATYWVLIDTAEQSKDPLILSSCESYRKTALVARRPANENDLAEVEEIVSHGIGSVYCRDLFRGRGYAGRMMEELRENLATWQQPDGRKSLFNVLYSDIGKTFYAKRGWLPFPSTSALLPPKMVQDPRPDLPQTRPIRAADLQELCAADEKQLRRSMADFSRSKAQVRVAFRPDAEVLEWQHSREEFIGKELGQPNLDIIGASVDLASGKRTWCIWMRKFWHEASDRTLFVTRIATDADNGFGSVDGSDGDALSDEQVKAIAACLRAAQEETARVQLNRVDIWNASAGMLKAARLLQADVKAVERDEESITSLLWYGSDVAPHELEWVSNDKFAWC